MGCTILTRVPSNPQCQSPHVRLRSSRLQVRRRCAHPGMGGTDSAGAHPHRTWPCCRLPHPETHSTSQTPENTSWPGTRWRCGGTAGALGGLGHRLSPDQGPVGGGVCQAVLCTSCCPSPTFLSGQGWGGGSGSTPSCSSPAPLRGVTTWACPGSPPAQVKSPDNWAKGAGHSGHAGLLSAAHGLGQVGRPRPTPAVA